MTQVMQSFASNDGGRDVRQPSDGLRARRRRGNLIIALSLFAFVVLVFVITLSRLGGDVLTRPM
jgi:hypothetical protein